MRTVSRPFVLSMYEALGFDTGKRESFAMSGGAPVFIFVVAMALLLVMWSLRFSDCQIPGRYERCGYLFSFRRYFIAFFLEF